MSRRTRKRRERNRAIIGATMGAVSLVVLLALVIWGQRGEDRLDPDGCPADGPAAMQVAVVLDPSDTLSVVQRQSAISRLMGTLEGLPRGAEVRVYTVAGAGRERGGADLRTCKPAHPDEVSAVTGNPALATEAYEAWREVIELRVGEALHEASEPESPIVEAIQFASVTTFQPRDAVMDRRLLIVSDMVQHSSDISFFRNQPDFGAFSRNPSYGTLRVDLARVGVTVFLLARRGEAGRIQAGNLRTFWEDYFLDQGAAASARPRWVQVEG